MPITGDFEHRIAHLYGRYAEGRLSRRDFMRRGAALGIAASAAGSADLLASAPSAAQVGEAVKQAVASGPLDLAEWSFFWLGVKRAKLARGTVVNGEQMYVEYWIPREVRHPYSIVLVHGGGGQGLDWLQTPDGRPGWVTLLLREGYKVYLVDRPGHGRSPFHPELHGPFPAQASSFAVTQRQFTAPEKAPMPYGPEAQRHTQWPGTGVEGDPTVDQVMAGQGGSFLSDLSATHAVWAERGGELLDRIGPAVVFAHSMGGPSCWIYGNARPNLVAGLVGVEPGGPPFGAFKWGLTASPVAYDPPAKDSSKLKTVEVKPDEPGRASYIIQAEPARKLKNLQHIPIAIVTSPASYHWPYDKGSVAFLRQAGCTVDHIELEKIGITGNAHFMAEEKNNREVLQPILAWLQAKVHLKPAKAAAGAAPARRPRSADDGTGLRLADQGCFFVGTEHKQMPYGTIIAAPMYVQYLIPQEVKRSLPIVLVHGGSGQMLHFMGIGAGASGWAHFFVRAGYKVYMVDRPGHGRCVYHPDSLGPINPQPTYELITPDTRRGAAGGRWPGTGDIGDPIVDQLMASQNATPQDGALAQRLWRSRGAALLDRIGPSVMLTHSAGGGFGWVVTDERPKLVKALVSFEGATAPLIQPPSPAGPGGAPAHAAPSLHPMPNLAGIPMMYLTAANSGRDDRAPVVDVLKQSGARAEHIALRDRGILGNGHFAMMETNRKEVFEVIRGWIERTVPA